MTTNLTEVDDARRPDPALRHLRGRDRRPRSCIMIAVLVAGGRVHELALHVRAALPKGLTRDELEEVLLQCAVCCGVPAATGSFAIAQRVLQEEGS